MVSLSINGRCRLARGMAWMTMSLLMLNAAQAQIQPTPTAPPAGAPPSMLKGLGGAKPGAEKPSSDPRNFEGTYVGTPMDMTKGAPPAFMMGMGNLPYKPKAAALAAERLALRQKNISVEAPSFYCRPFLNLTNPAQPLFPVKIAQTKDRIVLMTEEGRGVWEIFLDRPHPKKVVPTYNGHSVGHWEGDTLVVDIVGYNGKQWMDQMAGPNSTQSRATVWMKKIENGDKIEVKVQTDDPDMYSRPPDPRTYTISWNPDLRLLEFNCEEGLEVGNYAGIKAE